ncbi:hypothetical protein BDR06DRAFT_948031 [Suillus hirtellus]|nr:hypothetical protein BDR06DRAFT_948031 [Suillus hirtellus]
MIEDIPHHPILLILSNFPFASLLRYVCHTLELFLSCSVVLRPVVKSEAMFWKLHVIYPASKDDINLVTARVSSTAS